jgi:hypothetical protein
MTPKTRSGDPTILRKAAIGFSTIIVLTWAAEALHVPHYFFGEPVEFNWLRVLFRTAIILVIWAWVHLTTRRLLQRLHRLEEYLLICSWCRKVGYQGEWKTMEQFFGSTFNTETSHGICPECARKELHAHRTATRVASQAD